MASRTPASSLLNAWLAWLRALRRRRRAKDWVITATALTVTAAASRIIGIILLALSAYDPRAKLIEKEQKKAESHEDDCGADITGVDLGLRIDAESGRCNSAHGEHGRFHPPLSTCTAQAKQVDGRERQERLAGLFALVKPHGNEREQREERCQDNGLRPELLEALCFR